MPVISTSRLNKYRDDSTSLPKAGALTLRDTQQPGFAVRVSHTGSIKFVVSKRLKGAATTRLTIGTYGPNGLTVAQARDKARDWINKLSLGIDPNQELEAKVAAQKAEKELSKRVFADVYNDYYTATASQEDASKETIRDRAQVIVRLKDTALFNTPCHKLTKDTVEDALRPIYKRGQRATAAKCYRYCNTAFNREAVEKGIAGNPFKAWHNYYKPKPIKPRDTQLEVETESHRAWLMDVFNARNSISFFEAMAADYLMCLILWGGRKAETGNIKPADISFTPDREYVSFVNTKAGRVHYFPMTRWSQEILERRLRLNNEKDLADTIFCSPKQKAVNPWPLLRKLNIKHKTKLKPHDLRRTFAGSMAETSDLNQLVIKSSMNHAQDVTQDYIVKNPKVKALRRFYEEREIDIKKLLKIDAKKVGREDDLELLAKLRANPQVLAQLLAASN